MQELRLLYFSIFFDKFFRMNRQNTERVCRLRNSNAKQHNKSIQYLVFDNQIGEVSE